MSLRVQTVLYDGAEDQDFTGVLAAFGVLDDIRLSYVSADGPGTVTTASGAEITVGCPWSPETADLILVPGGGYGPGSAVDEQIHCGTLPNALARAKRPDLVLAAVCTGTLLLAAAGLTTDRPCTTHHVAKGDLAALGARVVGGRVVDDGDLVTSAGVTSGLDLGVWLVERLRGPEMALLVEEVLEYERRGTVWRSTKDHSSAVTPSTGVGSRTRRPT
ncbi:DJ-1/PfpI family protein [Kibdelosporangium phytohabitans]|uniref:DJ-1/PfpI family protein n=1 Tax=Kibdelosporangium phytohabitans TaxID=860235 RepID=UPI001A0AE525|nr:DJ-1/PfpI family protein [Kibdelosporangium phytohabitans]MBE1462042.1 transcriptional regulator GlxA family with amidase domain [Kibdelosporangium phytohabitans]